MGKIRIVLADDHEMVRSGVRRALEAEPDMAVVGEAADGRTCVELVARLRPDVAVVDIAMPGGGGLDAIRRVSAAGLDTRMIVLSIYKNDAYLYQAFAAGARAYVLKPTLTPNLMEAIRAVRRGEYYLSPKIESPFILSMVAGMIRSGNPPTMAGPGLSAPPAKSPALRDTGGER